jgi:RNA polymerase sigma factor for flagellar operon FliA
MQVQKRRSPTLTTRRSSRSAPAIPGARERDERRALVAAHVGLVHHVARQLVSRLSTEAELDELVSAGSLGLMQAAAAFEPARGLSFSTFAVPRIRGAMLDELRRVDPMPRNVRRRTREVARARDVLAASLHRAPTAGEIAGHLAVQSDEVHRWEFDAHSTNVVSFHQPARVEADTTLGDLLADERGTSVDELLTHEVEVEALKRAIMTLKEQERTVLALNYFEELKLQEIADVLHLSVCRISQIRTAALEKLRVALSELRAA